MSASRAIRQLAIRFISKPNCSLCVDAKEELEKLASKKGISILFQEVDILKPENKAFHDEFVFEIPVAQLADSGQELFRHRVNEEKLNKFLQSYIDQTKL